MVVLLGFLRNAGRGSLLEIKEKGDRGIQTGSDILGAIVRNASKMFVRFVRACAFVLNCPNVTEYDDKGAG